jgi:hypothetical protein
MHLPCRGTPKVVLVLFLLLSSAVMSKPSERFYQYQDNSISSRPLASVVVVDILWNAIGTGQHNLSFVRTQLCDACADRGFRIIRFAATPFWPVDWHRSFYRNETDYWRSVSTMLDVAEECHCQLIPSLFWNWNAIPDLVGEPLGQGLIRGFSTNGSASSSSASRRVAVSYLRKFVALTVNRTVTININTTAPSSTATVPLMYAYELGNELNLMADLDLSGDSHCVLQGCPVKRTLAQNFSTVDMIHFDSWLSDEIRDVACTYGSRCDASGNPVSISHGHSIPRKQAMHLVWSYHQRERDWTPDTEAQFLYYLNWTSFWCCDLVSVHYYASPDATRFGNTNPDNATLLPIMLSAMGTPTHWGNSRQLYIGEFGDCRPNVTDTNFEQSLLTNLASAPPGTAALATIWVWMFDAFTKTEPYPCSKWPDQHMQSIELLRLYNEGQFP